MLALITNDDGIEAEGLRCLTEAAVAAGLDVLVAAPFENSSGGSCSLIAVEENGRVILRRRDELELPSHDVFSVAAMPALITLMALQGTFGPVPDVVLSGLNDGHNTGKAVIHSGTLGAALTGVAHGCPGMALSLGTGEPRHWDTARAVATELVSWFVMSGERQALNVNVPNIALDELAGLRPARLAAFGAVQAAAVDAQEGSVSIVFEEVEREKEPGTDAALLLEGFVTVTGIEPVAEASLRDVASLLDRFVSTGRATVASGTG